MNTLNDLNYHFYKIKKKRGRKNVRTIIVQIYKLIEIQTICREKSVCIFSSRIR